MAATPAFQAVLVAPQIQGRCLLTDCRVSTLGSSPQSIGFIDPATGET
jgi:hypothetical protein